MSTCVSIRKPNRRVCVGDMVDVISIKSREISTPNFNNADYDNLFANLNPSVPEELSLIKTVKGKTFFDSVAEVDVNITHYVYVAYNPAITAEAWVYYDGQRLDILAVEDLDVRHDVMLLTCVDRGSATKNASKA